MKRFLWLFVLLFLLCGCDNPAESPTSEPSAPTQSTSTWVEKVGKPWDEAGALTQIPLNIPNALRYSAAAEFQGDLLLWGYDNHLEDTSVIELCLVELDDGSVTAQVEISLRQQTAPQILGDTLYLCDSVDGKILALDKTLAVKQTWEAPPSEGSWYMAGDTLYVHNWDGEAYSLNLQTQETLPLLDGLEITSMYVSENYATVEYYQDNTGTLSMALIDLLSGEVLEPPVEGMFQYLDYRNGTFLCGTYQDGQIYYIGSPGEGIGVSMLGEDSLRFLDDRTLLLTSGEGRYLSLHNLRGEALAKCQATSGIYTLEYLAVIPSETMGGYFCLVSEYNTSLRLLYWDPAQGERGTDLSFTAMPEPSQEEAQLKAKAQEISEKYGVSVLVGKDCSTGFLSFEAEQVTQWMPVFGALETLDRALSRYPADFFRQLRHGDIHTVEFQLVGNLQPSNAEEYVGSYSAFTNTTYDRYQVVVDIYSAVEQTYYHELSHVIDTYLAWNAENRGDALFSEERWAALNPDWFQGYSYTYSQEQELQDYTSFVDAYSTISPTEDRARVMEFSMLDVNPFVNCPILIEKCSYYSRCIRDAFETSSWPEILPWEQYL